MQSPKKGLICNLNHVHLQHVSLGLHLSRHPELQEDANTLAPPRDRVGCQDCRGHGGNTRELVDANSNNPSLPCRCCDGHTLHSDLKRGLQGQPLSPNCLALKREEEEEDEEEEEEEEEEAGSPSELGSSSVSSSSDISLDESPVSVYCREFPAEEPRSPENQPNIVPLEDARGILPLADRKDESLNLNTQISEPRPSRVWDSPDSLCSGSSLGSTPDMNSPCGESPVKSPLADSCRAPLPVPPPTRPFRAPPAVPAPKISPELDSNCNALPSREAEPGKLLVDVNSNQAAPPRPRVSSGPPPVPPRTKRGLQGLRRGEAGKPAVAPADLPPCHSDQQAAGSRKNITSFHELAQKRKKAAASVGPPPQTRKDQSDWLIVFSPDTELPPSNELTCGVAPCRETPGPPTPPSEPPANPAGQRGVTTFKELRCRKQKAQAPVKMGTQTPWQVDPGKGVPDGSAPPEVVVEPPPSGPFRPPKEIPPRRRKSRPGLQPIVEGGFEEGEDGRMEVKASDRSSEGPSNGRRDPWMPGKEERGERSFVEADALLARSSRPQNLPYPPLLVHFSVVDGPAPLHPSLCTGLESVELSSPAPPAPAFCPRLKTLSCEEVCLLAGRQGQVLGTLSPEELLPIRLSPIGAYSPPARSVLPFLESPDLAVLFSPLFPRSRTFPALAFPPRQVLERPFGARRAPLDSQAGAGLGRVPWGSMEAREPGAPKQLRHSHSFGGVPNTGHLWGADADRVYAQLREQKKALLVAVSASVDKIVAHFSTARNLVQKTQLGDSRLSPDIGYVVLTTLCPALRALVGDGLKPFQKDVITGQRPSSPWSVVEASAKPGPHARSLNALYWRVSRLAPLRSNQQRFHAFILGLLNMKQLEQWFANLQRNSELISALYLPTAFLVLSQGFCRRWADELLLLLQPLSMLTFQLDLLFEHQHLPLDVRPPPRRPTPPTELLAGTQKARGGSRVALPKRPPPLAGLAEGPVAQSSPLHEPQAGPPLHQRLLRWGDRLSHTFRGGEGAPGAEAGAEGSYQESEEKQQSWWEQLSRASGVYGEPPKQEGFPHTHWSKLRAALGEAVEVARSGAGEASVSPDVLPQAPSPRGSSSVESPRQAPAACEEGSSPLGEAAGKPEATCLPDAQEAAEKLEGAGTAKGNWLGWLFGAAAPGCANEADSHLSKSSRRPSSWLPPTMNILALVMKGAPAEKSWPEESWEDVPPSPQQPYRAVRALCDHAGSRDDHLSFRKGDVLRVLDTVDEDWIQCCHGDRRGLVPVGYTSLIL
uniref:RUN and SH3 domain-containing protein 1 isoform X1 n=1 Tax=Podarcis muralis TaxID=64176 RepID=UPI0010A0A54D|nr:RUN and SH3 domain-containing protein 1 isoform X1 [Podarcis muralis]XP_028565220.1 RUN and SH3 domain-containing protein 1 isoform X1 [Podarcis muralis]